MLTIFQDVGQREFVYNDEWAALASTSLKRVNEIELSVLDAIVRFFLLFFIQNFQRTPSAISAHFGNFL